MTPGRDFNISEGHRLGVARTTIVDGSLETNGFYMLDRLRGLHFLFRATSKSGRKRKDEAYLESDTTINPHTFTSNPG
jgi:hypothetical protein